MNVTKRFNAQHICGALVCFGLLVSLASAGGFDDHKLLQYVPGDSVVVVAGRSHDGQAFVKSQWQRVFDEVEKQHFERELGRVLKALTAGPATQPSPDQARILDVKVQEFTDAMTAVSWMTMADQSFVIFARSGFPAGVEVAAVVQPKAGTAAATGEQLRTMLKKAHALLPAGTVDLIDDNNPKTQVIRLTPAGGQIPISLTIAVHGDVIILGIGQSIVEQSLSLIQGESKGSITADAQFQKAFADMPPARDGLVYVDVARLTTQLRSIADQVMSMMDPGGDMLDAKTRALPGKLIEFLDIYTYFASTSTTDGKKTEGRSILALREDALTKPLGKALYGGGSIEELAKRIPKDARNFGLWSSVDCLGAYQAILEFAKTNFPEGEEAVAQWMAVVSTMPFSIEADILPLISGATMSFSIAGPTKFSSDAWVVQADCRKAPNASAALDRMLEWVDGMLKAQQGGVQPTKLKEAEGFKTIGLPGMMALILQNVIVGMHDGWLIVGSSPKVVDLAIQTASGKAENVLSSTSFTSFGLKLGPKSISAMYSNLRKLGETLSQAILMGANMPAMLGGGDMRSNPAMQAMLSTLSKLGFVIRKLDFWEASALVSELDGNIVRSTTVLTYRDPVADEAAEAAAAAKKNAKADPKAADEKPGEQ